MTTDETQGEANGTRRMMTIDKVPNVSGEVVTYATTDGRKLKAIQFATLGKMTPYDASTVQDIIDGATFYEVVAQRGKKQLPLDSFPTEGQARAYVRGMVSAARFLAPKIEKLKRGVKAGL